MTDKYPQEHHGASIAGDPEEPADASKTPTKDQISVRVAGQPSDRPVSVAKVLLTTVIAVRAAAKPPGGGEVDGK